MACVLWSGRTRISFSTLHTNSAAGAFPRLIDMKAEPFLIASTVNLIVAQRLVRRLYPESKEKYKLSSEELKQLEEQFDLNKVMEMLRKEKLVEPKKDWKEIVFCRPGKVKECPDGYKGRIGIFEILEVNDEIKKLIIQEADADRMEEQSKKQGMLTMMEDGLIKAALGITSIEEVLRVTTE